MDGRPGVRKMIDRGIVKESRRVRVARRHAHLPVDAALDRAVAPGRGEHGGALDSDRALDARDGGVPVRLRSVREVHGNDEAAHQAWYTSPGSSWTSTIWRPWGGR